MGPLHDLRQTTKTTQTSVKTNVLCTVQAETRGLYDVTTNARASVHVARTLRAARRLFGFVAICRKTRWLVPSTTLNCSSFFCLCRNVYVSSFRGIKGFRATCSSTHWTTLSYSPEEVFGADFANNSLLALFRPDLLHLPRTNGEHCTSDAIKLSEAIGAKTIDLEWAQVHPT